MRLVRNASVLRSNESMKILFDVVSGVIMTALFFGPPFAMLFGSFTSHLPVDLSGKFQFSHLQEWLDIVHLTIDAIKKKKTAIETIHS